MEQDGSITQHMERLDRVRAQFTAWCCTEGREVAGDLLRDHSIRNVPTFMPPAEWRRTADNVLAYGAFRAG
jgi:hypothetical protein